MKKFHPIEQALDEALTLADAPPPMPASLQPAVMAAFPARRFRWPVVATSFGALAASLALAFGAMTAWQSYQAEQAAIAADADAFAEELIGDVAFEGL